MKPLKWRISLPSTSCAGSIPQSCNNKKNHQQQPITTNTHQYTIWDDIIKQCEHAISTTTVGIICDVMTVAEYSGVTQHLYCHDVSGLGVLWWGWIIMENSTKWTTGGNDNYSPGLPCLTFHSCFLVPCSYSRLVCSCSRLGYSYSRLACSCYRVSCSYCFP